MHLLGTVGFDVTTRAWHAGAGLNDVGAVYLLYLGAEGSVASVSKISATTPGLRPGNDGAEDFADSSSAAATYRDPFESSDRFGSSVAAVSDMDGDGVPELAVGAPYDDDGSNSQDRGAIHLLWITRDGSVKSSARIGDRALGPRDVTDYWAALNNEDHFGSGLASVGDLDNDGMDELAVGSEWSDGSGSYAQSGSRHGSVRVLFLDKSDATVRSYAWIGPGRMPYYHYGLERQWVHKADAYFGRSVASLGDLDGDGLPETIGGAYRDSDGGTRRGAAYVVFHSADGTARSCTKLSTLAYKVAGSDREVVTPLGDGLDEYSYGTGNYYFGYGVGPAGDVNGDGVPDALIGATGAPSVLNRGTGAESHEWGDGAVWLLYLASNGLAMSYDVLEYDADNFAFGASSSQMMLGSSLTILGDLDRDGKPWIAMGALEDSHGGSSSGAAYLMKLSGSHVAPSCEDGEWNGDEAGPDCGGSCTSERSCPTCDDDEANGDESGVDCGGSCPHECPISCSDGLRNGEEDGVDCGKAACGSVCPGFVSVGFDADAMQSTVVVNGRRKGGLVDGFGGGVDGPDTTSYHQIVYESDSFGASMASLGDLDGPEVNGTGASVWTVAVGAPNDDDGT